MLAPFWMVCLAGLGFLAAPLVAYWLASPWFAKLWPSLSPGGHGDALFAAMGAGIAAFLAGPLLLYAEQNPALDVTLMSVIVMGLAYLLGRTLDYSDPLPLSLAFVPLILTMPAGAALLHADTTWLGIAAASIVATGVAVVAGSALVRQACGVSHRAPTENQRPSPQPGSDGPRHSGRCPRVGRTAENPGLPAVSVLSIGPGIG